MRMIPMKELSKDTMIERELEREKEDFLKSVDVKVLDNTNNTSLFNAIIDSRRGIVIK